MSDYSELADKIDRHLRQLAPHQKERETAVWLERSRDALNIIAQLQAKCAELQDFAIWMTGCGYDFSALPYFCEQREKLLKGK